MILDIDEDLFESYEGIERVKPECIEEVKRRLDLHRRMVNACKNHGDAVSAYSIRDILKEDLL